MAVTASMARQRAWQDAPGYMFVSEYAAGDPWYEDHSEGWFSFHLEKIDWAWRIVSFGRGNQ